MKNKKQIRKRKGQKQENGKLAENLELKIKNWETQNLKMQFF